MTRTAGADLAGTCGGSGGEKCPAAAGKNSRVWTARFFGGVHIFIGRGS